MVGLGFPKSLLTSIMNGSEAGPCFEGGDGSIVSSHRHLDYCLFSIGSRLAALNSVHGITNLTHGYTL